MFFVPAVVIVWISIPFLSTLSFFLLYRTNVNLDLYAMQYAPPKHWTTTEAIPSNVEALTDLRTIIAADAIVNYRFCRK